MVDRKRSNLQFQGHFQSSLTSTLGPTKYVNKWEQWRTAWNCHQTVKFMMYFMFPSLNPLLQITLLCVTEPSNL
jgi:hypothetical protein